jgi:hypothetical protein
MVFDSNDFVSEFFPLEEGHEKADGTHVLTVSHGSFM